VGFPAGAPHRLRLDRGVFHLAAEEAGVLLQLVREPVGDFLAVADLDEQQR